MYKYRSVEYSLEICQYFKRFNSVSKTAKHFNITRTVVNAVRRYENAYNLIIKIQIKLNRIKSFGDESLEESETDDADESDDADEPDYSVESDDGDELLEEEESDDREVGKIMIS